MKECQVCKQCYPDAVTNCPEDNQPTFHSIGGDPILEGKYRLEKRLGQGGMGVVYQARHSFLKTAHAIKVILPDLVGNDPQLVTRFRQEALAAAAIRHHNVVQVTDYGVAQDTMPFLVMEFVEGESLHDLLAREQRLSPERAVELMSAISAGVGAAHKQGIVHRDLKPLNVMILKNAGSMSEGIKILDFGLAKIKSGELLGSFVQAQTTGLMGSPYYMAPEQWADEDPDAQADVYSLGIMLYQMLAGDVPFKGSSIPAIMKKHLYDSPPPFAGMGVAVPPEFEAAVFHALIKDRHERTQSVQAFVDELKQALGLSSQSLGNTSGNTAGFTNSPSTVHVLTSPPQSKIFLDNVQIGESQPDGWLLLEGVQSGLHRLRVVKDGFRDWENQIVCDGKPQQVVAKLETAVDTRYKPVEATQIVTQNTPDIAVNTQGIHGSLHNTSSIVSNGGVSQPPPPNWQNSQQYVDSQPPPVIIKESPLKPIIWAISGIFGLLLLTGIGAGVAYKAGLFGNSNVTVPPGNTQPPANVNENSQPKPPVQVKNELVDIPGGKYMMGRSDGPLVEQPAHEIEVKDFKMDKTEVTNAEYAVFVAETGYKAPGHWANNKPVAEDEMKPVVRVSLADAKAFAKWRSARDHIEYRLPTEEEWEYAARNGSENNLFPWGDQWKDNKSNIDSNLLRPVGSYLDGNNKWGVEDLIGNVWEWTDSEAKLYPGSKNGEIVSSKVPKYMIRGGSCNSKPTGEKAITATSRLDVPMTQEDGLLGFRLVAPK